MRIRHKIDSRNNLKKKLLFLILGNFTPDNIYIYKKNIQAHMEFRLSPQEDRSRARAIHKNAPHHTVLIRFE